METSNDILIVRDGHDGDTDWREFENFRQYPNCVRIFDVLDSLGDGFYEIVEYDIVGIGCRYRRVSADYFKSWKEWDSHEYGEINDV